jgi:phage terminase small subunit
MTKRKLRFVDEYLKDFNQTQACIRAGYSERSAKTAASRLMADVNLVALINQRLELVRANKQEVDEFNHNEIRKCFRAIYERCMQAEPVMRWNPTTKEMEPVRDENGDAVYMFDSTGANRAMENIAKNKGFFELDNSQKRPLIQIAIKNDVYTNNEDAGNTNRVTDTGVFTLLPPATDE